MPTKYTLLIHKIKDSPSVFLNSIFTNVVYWLASVACLLSFCFLLVAIITNFMAGGIEGTVNIKSNIDKVIILLLALSFTVFILLYLIVRLTKMVKKRNAYIFDLHNIVDEIEEQEK